MANWLILSGGRTVGRIAKATRLRTSKWITAGNQARVTVSNSSVRSLKNSIGDDLQAINRAIYNDGQFLEAVQAIDEMRYGSRETGFAGVKGAIEESVYSGGQGIDVGIGRRGRRDLYKETDFVMPENRMASHLTLTDLVGLDDALAVLRKTAIQRAIRGTAVDPITNRSAIKNNPYREAFTRLTEQSWVKKLDNLSALQLDKLKSDIAVFQTRNIYKSKTKDRINLPENVQKVLDDFTQVEYDALYAVIDRAKSSEMSKQLTRQENLFDSLAKNSERRRVEGDVAKAADLTMERPEQIAVLRQTVEAQGREYVAPLDVIAELDQRPLNDQILKSFDARPGKPLKVGPDTEVVRPDNRISVDPFINTLIDRQSRRLTQLTDIPARNIKIALTRLTREVFERGVGMLASSDLQGAVKQLALRKMKQEAKAKHNIIMDQGLVDQASTALDQILARFDRPFRLVDPNEVVTLQSLGLTDVVQNVGIKGGNDVKVTIPLEPLFNEALQTVRQSKKISESEIAMQAAMKISKMLSDEARQAAFFKSLRNDSQRLNIVPERMAEINSLLARENLSPSDRAYINQTLLDTGSEMVASVFGRNENAIGGLNISKATRNQLQRVIRSNPEQIIKAIEGQRGKKLSKAERKDLIGEGGNVIQTNSRVGEYLAWLDTWSEIGNVEVRSVFSNRRQALSDSDLAAIRNQIFPKDSMLNQSLEATFKDSDYLVSPEWNQAQGFELVGRMELDNLSALLSRNQQAL